MSTSKPKAAPDTSFTNRVIIFSILYLAVYGVVSWADLFATKLALQQPNTVEGNVYWLVGQVSNATNPTLGFWLVLGPLFYLLAFACSPLAVLILRRFGAGSRDVEQPPDMGRFVTEPDRWNHKQ